MNRIPFTNALFGKPKGAKFVEAKAIIDTGASFTVIPASFVSELGLERIGSMTVSLIDRTIEVSTYLCQVAIKGKSVITPVIAIDSVDNPLIGMDIIDQKTMTELLIPQIFSESIGILQSISNIKEHCVLILGQDTTEIERLKSIKRRLASDGYIGIIVKEITDIEIQSVEEKVNMLASLCRFVICDNTVASGHIDELKICANNRFVTAILQEHGRGATWMQSDYCVDYSFMKTFYYPSSKELEVVVDTAVEWAERKIKERRSKFNAIYGWRKQEKEQ
jgi:predicted aspartyl protease